jgi:hypothetical protein
VYTAYLFWTATKAIIPTLSSNIAKKKNIITFCMPAHFPHILQPLNMACFAPLKKAYGTQIEKLVRARISHIIKEDFFPAFCDAFKKSLTESNIRAGF